MDSNSFLLACSASIDSEFMIISKLIRRNKSQHRSTHVFKLLQQIQRIYSLIPLNDVNLLLESLKVKSLSTQQLQKLSSNSIDGIFSLCKDSAKAVQWLCELVDACSKAGRLLIVSVEQKLFVPLYCTFLASCSRVLRNASKLCIHLYNEIEVLLNYLKNISSSNDKFESLIAKEINSFTCYKCYCINSKQSICSGLICTKFIRLINVLRIADSTSSSNATFSSLRPSLSLNFGLNKRKKRQTEGMNYFRANNSVANLDKPLETVSETINLNNPETINSGDRSRLEKASLDLLDDGDADIGYVMAVINAENLQSTRVNESKKTQGIVVAGRGFDGLISHRNVDKDSGNCSHDKEISNELLMVDIFDTDQPTNSSSTLPLEGLKRSKGESGERAQKKRKKLPSSSPSSNFDPELDDIFSGL